MHWFHTYTNPLLSVWFHKVYQSVLLRFTFQGSLNTAIFQLSKRYSNSLKLCKHLISCYFSLFSVSCNVMDKHSFSRKGIWVSIKVGSYKREEVVMQGKLNQDNSGQYPTFCLLCIWDSFVSSKFWENGKISRQKLDTILVVRFVW